MSILRRLAPVVLSALLVASCANVPREAVDLSYQIGNDTEALHQSYRKLIRAHFQAIRQIYEAQWTEKVLVPFVTSFVQESRLVEIAQRKVVWDPVQDKFVQPTPGREAVQFVDTMSAWSKEFTETTQRLRKEFLAPVDVEEANLMQTVDEAFAQVGRGNAAISAHLASLRKVQEAQDSLLEKADMKGLRQKINDGIAKASNEASDLTSRVSAATRRIEELKARMKLK